MIAEKKIPHATSVALQRAIRKEREPRYLKTADDYSPECYILTSRGRVSLYAQSQRECVRLG